MSQPSPTLERLVDRCGQLYSLPVVAMRVLELTESPAVDVRAIKECIENDPALTSKVLRVVNSSLFGLSREVTDLNQAIALLGINPLKLLVLGFSLPSELFVGLNGDILRRYWHRTLVKAVAAREISQTILRMPGDEAFIAGLLQDIGALVLLQEMGDTYARFLDELLSKAPNAADAERATLGFDHIMLSAGLLERWRLPAPLVTAVEAGQSREQIELLPAIERPLAQVLLLADLVGGMLAENRTDLLIELLDRGREYLGLTHTQLASLVTALAAKVDPLAEVLQLELPQGHDYRAILVEAHQRLSAVASDAAEQLLAGKAATEGFAPDESLLAELRRLSDEMARTAESSKRPAARREKAAAASQNEISMSPMAMRAPAEAHGTLPLASNTASSIANTPPLTRFGEPISQSAPATRRASASHGDISYEPGFVGRVSAAVATCRQARRSLSLLMVEIDQYDDLLLVRGPDAAEQAVEQLGAECRRLDHRGAVVVQSRDLQFAVILPDCDRRQAVDVSNELIARVRRAALSSDQADAAMAAATTVSIGVASVALAPRNFPAAELIRAAERCLGGARLSGGNAVKSIEIY